jgi:hypothetical protein
MFCPQCSTQNEAKQSYCRQCGQTLSAVHLALSGRADEAIARFRQARKSLNYGLTFLGMFILIALFTFLLAGVVPYAVLGIGFVVCLPSILKGVTLLKRVGDLLNASEVPNSLITKRTVPSAIESTPTRATNSMDVTSHAPDSVAVGTTLDLNTYKPKD